MSEFVKCSCQDCDCWVQIHPNATQHKCSGCRCGEHPAWSKVEGTGATRHITYRKPETAR